MDNGEVTKVGIDSQELLAALLDSPIGKQAAIGAAELQGGMPPGGDPAAMGAMPPGADPAAMGAMPPGADPAAMGAMPPGADPSMGAMPPGGDPAAMGAPDPLSEAIMQIADGQMQVMQKLDNIMKTLGYMLDHLGLKVPASQVLLAGGELGGAKKASNVEIKDGFEDDEPESAITILNDAGSKLMTIPATPTSNQKVSDYYHRFEDGDTGQRVKEASSPKTALHIGETGEPGGEGIKLQTRLVAAPAKNLIAARAINLRRGR